MSNLLKEAMVDAKALREAALKNAESTIINKYSEEVRSTLEQLLEQEEDALGGFGDLGGGDAALTAEAEEPVAEGEDVDPTIPLAATDGLAEEKGENLSNLQEEGEDVPVTINLDALREAIEQLVEGDKRVLAMKKLSLQTNSCLICWLKRKTRSRITLTLMVMATKMSQ